MNREYRDVTPNDRATQGTVSFGLRPRMCYLEHLPTKDLDRLPPVITTRIHKRLPRTAWPFLPKVQYLPSILPHPHPWITINVYNSSLLETILLCRRVVLVARHLGIGR